MDPFHVMSTCKSLRLSVHTINYYWNIRGKLKVQLESAIYSKLGGFFPRKSEKKITIIKIQKSYFCCPHVLDLCISISIGAQDCKFAGIINTNELGYFIMC